MRLRNYRGVADCEVEFPVQGVTVVEGPNEAGKTSIPEGLDLVLTKLDSSGHRQVKSAKPVGRDVGPEVEIEMSTGPYRFVYHKRWLRRSETVLSVLTPQHDQLTGRAAHERVEEILDETLDRDLWRALRIEQGTELALPGFDVPSLVAALDQAASGAGATDEDDDLWTRICEERDRYWTATGRPKRDRNAQQAAVETAQSRVSELEQQLKSIDRDAAEVSSLAAAARRLAEARDQAEQRERELSSQWESARRLREKVQRLATSHEAATAKQDNVLGDRRRRQELIDELDSRDKELEALKTRAEQSAPSLAAAIRHAEQTVVAVEEARTALRRAEDDQRQANADRDHHRQHIEVEQLSERYGRVIQAEKALKDAEVQLASATLDDELLEQIEQAHLAVVRAEAAVSSVEITASQALSMQINSEVVALVAGETQRTVVNDEVVLTFPDVAKIRVRAGTGSQSLATQRQNAHDTFRRLCVRGGVADLAGARAMAEQRHEAERNRDLALAAIRRDLRDLTVDVLDAKIKGLTERTASYAAERSGDPPLPADFDEAKEITSEMDRIVAERRVEFETCNDTATKAAEALSAAQLKEADLNGQIKNARGAKQVAIDRLAAARQERADANITADLLKARDEADAVRRALEEAEAELSAADPESLETRLNNARQAAERARGSLQSNETRQNALRIGLAIRGEDGLHTRHDDAASRLRHLEREHQSIEARAQATRLLHDTFSQRRQEARQRYVVPLKDRIEQLGRIVFNPSFSVDIDESLRIVRRKLDGDTLRVDQLSAGTLEQLAVISRLACAAIVSPDGAGAPVIIDDALGWSDPDRLERMGAAIAAVGGQCQVIILTCTPGRYAHIGKATTIRLPSRT